MVSGSPVIEPPAPDFAPVRVLEVELAAPLARVEARPSGGRRYGGAFALVTVHGIPVGQIELDLIDGGVDPDTVAAAVGATLSDAVAAHRRADGLPPAPITPAGFDDGPEPPRCARDRAAFLADAPRLTVIIPSRDRADRLEGCLRSILACEYPRDRFEVLVVDNAPASDDTRRLVAEVFAADGVRYVREDAPGSASARNAGLAAGGAEIVVFTDDDVRVDRHWLTETARGFSVDGADCVTGLLVPLELETPAQVWFEEYGGFSRGYAQRIFDLGEHRPADVPLYPYSAGIFGTGNNMAFRRSVLTDIGDFDPALGNGTPALGGVDSEVLLRTILTGHRIVYQPTSLVWHRHRRDYAGLHRQVWSYGTGLTAYLLKTVLQQPWIAADFARKIPRGLTFALDPRSAKNEHKRASYPRELTRAEVRGMLYGPVAYARSRRAYGPHRLPPAGVEGGRRAARRI